MNGGDVPLRGGWLQSAHRVPAMGPRPRWPLRPHSFPPRYTSWFCLVSSSTDQESHLVFGFLEPTPNTHRWGSGRGPTLTHTCPHVMGGTAIWVPCPPPTGFLFSTQIFMCHTFSFLPLEGLLITLLNTHCQCLSLGQETGLGDRRPRT